LSTLEIISEKLKRKKKIKLIRVPYYSTKNYLDSDRIEPDDRDLEETDPYFKIA